MQLFHCSVRHYWGQMDEGSLTTYGNHHWSNWPCIDQIRISKFWPWLWESWYNFAFLRPLSRVVLDPVGQLDLSTFQLRLVSTCYIRKDLFSYFFLPSGIFLLLWCALNGIHDGSKVTSPFCACAVSKGAKDGQQLEWTLSLSAVAWADPTPGRSCCQQNSCWRS